MEPYCKELLADAYRRSSAYAGSISQRRVRPCEAAVAALARFREPFPEEASLGADVLALLDDIGSPATVATTGSRYFGYVIGGVLPVALAANWLAAAWDQNSTLTAMSPTGAALEEIALGWIVDALGLDAGCGGAFVTGATMANFTGLAAARHALLARDGWNMEEDGLFGAPPITVIAGEEVHASVLKAIAMLGLGRRRVIMVPTDSQGRIRPECIGPIPGRAIVLLQAGNVNSGSFDRAREVCEKAHAAGAWVHVDGAFGLWQRVSREFDHLTAGYEDADSWSLDAHKWLNVNYDSGILLTRNAAHLRGAFTSAGAYMEPGKGREPGHHSPEMSRRARGIDVWAALKFLGRTGLADLVERTCGLARQFAVGLREAGFEILNDVVSNQVLVSFGEDACTRAVVRAIQKDGTCWCGETVWHGRAAMRISVSSWRTAAADVRMSVEAMVRCARGLA
jgi:glutamate/tyrosine decarboxylase-like PLP-dependent enzyme